MIFCNKKKLLTAVFESGENRSQKQSDKKGGGLNVMPDNEKNKAAYSEPMLDVIVFPAQSQVVTVSGDPVETDDGWSKDYL